MSVPSMVHRSGDTLVVRSVVSGDALYGSADDIHDCVDKSTDIANLSEKELPECKVKRNYSCGTCDFFTQNPRVHLYHLRDVHKEKVKIYECPNCLYASRHFQKLLRHTKMVHGSSDSEFAPKKSRKRPAAVQPPQTEPDESNESHTSADESQPQIPEDETIEIPTANDKVGLKCTICAFVAKNHVQLSKHERDEHIKTRFFRCTKCSYVTHMKARFTKHVKYHSMPMIKCDMCDFRTPYKWNLDRHCKNHNGKGNFKCSACNFTADIKQSLTVHEMNHHVPPVGQAAGLGVGRRRNKVGASDTTAAEEAALQVQSEPDQCEAPPSGDRKTAHKLKIPAKKLKSANNQENGGDFVHPDDIVQHANGNVYIKNKCRLCNFKTAWDGEMARHEERVHGNPLNVVLPPVKKKPSRPVPNLIPITPLKQQKTETMSQKDMKEILARSYNSDLKDFASLFGSEDVFRQETKVPDQFPVEKKSNDFERKNASFFDKLKEKLSGDATENLKCRLCGHESKCLTESLGHQKICGKEPTATINVTSMHKLTSTRCQHCRQRCKSSMDLYNHLQTCLEAIKHYAPHEDDPTESQDDDVKDLEIVTEEDNSRSSEKEPHPMENRVFVWNNIEVPLDVEIEESNQYEYVDEKQDYPDLSTRTQSPSSESSVVEMIQSTPPVTQSFDKVPTHGNDISIAQHKRVFKCPHCTFWASTASRFHVHIVGHLNKKPFECSLCSYRSNWRWDITKHIKLKSVRDQAHESAKVLMTDETGRRNYTKYNKYLTEINLSGGPDHQETSGGMGTRPKHHDSKHDLPKVKHVNTEFPSMVVKGLRPPPPLTPADGSFFNKLSSEKKRSNNDGKKTLWQCKKCNFRDPCKEKLLAHVKSHYTQTSTSSPSPSSSALSGLGMGSMTYSGDLTGGDLDTEASVGGGGATRGQAPFRCGHCHQVSNWKHVIQRHCRLKHGGNINVIVGTKQQEKVDSTDTSFEEPEDVSQVGTFKCPSCPFGSDHSDEFQLHLEGHSQSQSALYKCIYCHFGVNLKEDLYQHVKLHGIANPIDYLQKFDKQNISADLDQSKRYRCTVCPYDTNSKSQFTYHKQFHKPNGPYSCTECSYNVSRRHLLHQHMKVHGINVSPQKQNGEIVDLGEISDEIEEIPPQTYDWQTLRDIPLVWVSKGDKFSKMYKCRYCPHVNLRKVNIQEHEKMHGLREKNPAKGNETEHRCPECNYVCNNAGVLSSHSKVHQGIYGMVHGIVDNTKTDEEQIRELGSSQQLNSLSNLEDEESELQEDPILFFCPKCPARFLKETEFEFHLNFHGAKLAYRCDHCTYSARQKAHIDAHNKVHTYVYQKRTKELMETSNIHPDNLQPEVSQSTPDVWVVSDDTISDSEMEIEYSYPKRTSVPLSGTELFQQKSEAEANEKLLPESSQNSLGKNENQNFAFPNTKKRKRVRERRYKCEKCPSAFEKREQFNLHCNLHGSDQQYKCNQCDYSVRYYANFVQHEKKHKLNDDQNDSTKETDEENQDEIQPKRRLSKESSSSSPTSEEKKLFWCAMCPYTNHRKDAVDNHQRRHVTISGMRNNYTCGHCDYSVPQSHFLRDHMKLHFMCTKMHKPEAFTAYDSLKLSTKISEGVKEESGENMIFKNNDIEPVKLNLNNNEGEKMFVNTQTGEIVDVKQIHEDEEFEEDS